LIQGFAGFWSPPVALYETDDNLVLHVELPGMSLGEVELFANPRSVIVRGTRRPPETGLSAERLEIRTGRFERDVQLPCRIDVEGVRASMKDGVLCIEMPKAAGGAVGIRIDQENPDD